MSKKAIIAELRGRGLTVPEAEQQLENVVGAIKAVISKEKKAAIPAFGVFSRKMQGERKTRNPRTGETMTIAAREKTSFKESKVG